MARLIPSIDVGSISNSGERIVAQALVEQLPSACLVYHSYPWLRLTRSDFARKGFLQPGEADFIIVHPELGLLVLEVKGGTIEYEPASHRFFRDLGSGRQEQIQNPFDQAARNLYSLRDAILGHELFRNDSALPFAHGYAVALPHCAYSGPLPPDATHEIIYSANDINTLEQRVHSSRKLNFPSSCRRLSASLVWFRAVHLGSRGIEPD